MYVRNRRSHVIRRGRPCRGNRKLTYQIAEQIRKDHVTEGISYRKLAYKYNIGSTTVGNILHNRTYLQD